MESAPLLGGGHPKGEDGHPFGLSPVPATDGSSPVTHASAIAQVTFGGRIGASWEAIPPDEVIPVIVFRAMLDHEALALLSLGYRECFYLELYCPDHGAIRCAIPFPNGQTHPCPSCGRECSCESLARGYTRRDLPFHEVVDGPATSWLRADPDTVVVAEPKPLVKISGGNTKQRPTGDAEDDAKLAREREHYRRWYSSPWRTPPAVTSRGPQGTRLRPAQSGGTD